MATRTTAGTTSQFISWSTAPKLQAFTGTAQTFNLNDYIRKPNASISVTFSLVSGTYPAGWAWVSAAAGTIAWNGSATPTASGLTLRWRATSPKNGAVNSPLGSVTAIAPPVQLPVAPTNIQATVDSPTQITVTWVPGVGGSTITSYQVYRTLTGAPPYADVGAAVVPPAANTKTDATLQPNQQAWYMVVATDGNGATAQSVTATATTPYALPAKPVNVTATPNGTTITVAWEDGTLGTASVNDLVRRSSTGVDGSFALIQSNATSPYDDTGLTPGDTWWYRISANDAQGNYTLSDPVQATVPLPALPAVPTNLALQVLGATAIKATWQAGSGGSEVTEYRLHRSTSANAPYTPVHTIAAPTLEKTDTGRAESTRYYYRVRAYDGTNLSNESVEQSAQTVTVLPDVPVILSVVAQSSTVLRVTWQAGSTPNTSVPTKYELHGSASEGGPYVQVGADITAPATTADESGLAAAQTRWYKVKALDAMDDESALSAAVSGTTKPAAVPAMPINVTAQVLNATTIRVSWQPGASDTSVTGFNVYRNTTGTNFVPPPRAANDAASPYDDTVTTGTKYYYCVSAVSAAGEGPQSQVASATATAIITVGPSGKDHTTIAAGLNAAGATTSAPTIVEVYNGTYTAAVISVRAGTAAKPIVLRAAAGQTPVVTGKSSVYPRANMTISHAYCEFGQGIEFRGDNTGAGASYNAATVDTGILIKADNVTAGGICTKHKKDNVRITPGQDRIRLSNLDVDIAGTLDSGATSGDASDGENIFVMNTSGGNVANLLLDTVAGSRGGHNVLSCTATATVLCRNMVLSNDWNAIFSNMGYRIGVFLQSAVRTVVEDSVWHSAGTAVDRPGSSNAMKAMSANMTFRRCFFLGNEDASALLAIQAPAASNSGFPPGASDQRWAHVTAHGSAGELIKLSDTGMSPGLTDPIYFKNCIFSGLTGSLGITIVYYSSKLGNWKQGFFWTNCIFGSNFNVRVEDKSGSHAVLNTTIGAILAAPATYPNFVGCTQVSPNFVSTAVPTSRVPATAFAQASANYLPQAAAALGTGTYLTRVNGASSGVTVTVDDGKWFRDGMGWSGISGDTIYIENVGTRVISSISGNVLTLTQSANVVDNAKVWLGTDSTPNIGAAL